VDIGWSAEWSCVSDVAAALHCDPQFCEVGVINDLKPYPAYKDSGVPWLGKVPEHWEVKRGKNLFHCIDVRSSTGEEELLTVSSERGIVPRRSAVVTMFKAQSYVSYKLCWPGDLVINSLWAWARGLGVSRYHGIVSTAYGVYRLRQGSNCDARFINELVRSTPFHWELRVRSKGVWTSRLQLTDESFLGAPFPKPPVSEQSAIVRFLAHADRRIKCYIRAKQKLIKLLEEQKQAIIHRAVTRGVDPNVRLKPSGVEWLGNFPEHWKVRLLGRCLKRIDQGWSPVAAEGELAPDQWAVLTLSSVKGGEFDPAAIKPVSVNARVPSGIEIDNGDLLVTRSNTRELVGDVCITRNVRPRTLICDLIYRLVPDAEAFNSRFLMFQLLSRTGRNQIERDARGSSGTMPKIAQRHIRSWQVIVPPLHEQESIAAAIEEMVTRAQRAVGRTHEEISLLREYRTRLIADVVTGKLDVREAAAKLPEETDEYEAPDDAESSIEDDEATEDTDLDATPEEAEA
jgi:type I restriction enzyme S subunit